MREKFVLAFDIGSSKLRAMVAGKGLNGTFSVKGYKEIDYDGFYEGEFLNKDKLPSIFEEVVAESSPYIKKTKKVYNILGDYPDVVAKFLVEEMLKNTKNNAHIEWLTTAKAAFRFMTAGFNKRDFFKED